MWLTLKERRLAIIDPIKLATGISDGARKRAAALDRDACFPSEDIDALASSGLLGAILPSSLGGLMQSDAQSGLLMFHLLHLIGEGSLALGRLFEAHVNALHLIMKYGSVSQQTAASNHAQAGKLFGLWVTDALGNPLLMTPRGPDIKISGAKDFCSGAGHADYAVVTATNDREGRQMLILQLRQGEEVFTSGHRLHGMRAAVTGKVDFTGYVAGLDAMLGVPGDYLLEPEFSAGAWRGSAVALGGMSALLKLTCHQLIGRQRDTDPHQRVRLGRIMIAYRTGYLWLTDIARRIFADLTSPAETVAYVNLARITVEAGCLDAIQAVQRSLGLSAFVESNPVERITRDLATYLRQPAPDEALDEAVAYFITHPMPKDIV